MPGTVGVLVGLLARLGQVDAVSEHAALTAIEHEPVVDDTHDVAQSGAVEQVDFTGVRNAGFYLQDVATV